MLASHALAQQRCASGRACMWTQDVSLRYLQEQDTAAPEGCTAKHHRCAWKRTQPLFLSVQVLTTCFGAATCFEPHTKVLLF